MNIFSYFQKKGIDTVDSSFYRKIEEWKSWYRGNIRPLEFRGWFFIVKNRYLTKEKT